MNRSKSLIRFSSIILFALSVTLLGSCSATKTGTDAEFMALQQRVESNEPIRIRIISASPSNTLATQQVLTGILRNMGDNAARVDLQGDGHFMEISRDQVVASLPFFGERRQGGGSYGANNSDAGINFNTAPDEYSVKKDAIKNSIDIDFDANNNTENFDVSLILFGNGKVNVYIIGSTRTQIQYQGEIVELEE